LGENSAELAGTMGAGYIFGHFIKPDRGPQAFQKYRASFTESSFISRPRSIAAIFVVCAATDDKAEELALSQDLWLLRVEKGLDSRIPSIEEAKAYAFSNKEKEKVKENRKRMVIGSPKTVKDKLDELSDRYQTDEFMILTNVYDFDDKKQSYERLMECLTP
jgi:luciferase family oxidoreductase group 1